MFKLSAISEKNLIGVDERLVNVVRHAIAITKVDFRVIEGLRTRERQAELYRSGASKTMNSKHLVGKAVDLAPMVGGKIRWDWPLFYPIAEAMKMASDGMLEIRWGGNWGLLSQIDDPEQAVADYVVSRKAAGKSAFIDGPHFEIGD